MPEQTHLWESKPTRYISHLLGHEGSGSLLSGLKHEGLSTELGAGTYIDCAGISLFVCKINLTEKGATQEGIDRVGQLVYSYIR